MKLLILAAGITALFSSNMFASPIELIDAVTETGVQVDAIDFHEHEHPPLLIKDSMGNTYLAEARGNINTERVEIRLLQSCDVNNCTHVKGWAFDAGDMMFGLKADISNQGPEALSVVNGRMAVDEKSQAEARCPTLTVKAGEAIKLLIDGRDEKPSLARDDRFKEIAREHKRILDEKDSAKAAAQEMNKSKSL
jgi:hypothetical protein